MADDPGIAFEVRDIAGEEERNEGFVGDDAAMDESSDATPRVVHGTSSGHSGIGVIAEHGVELAPVGVDNMPPHVRSKVTGVPSHMCLEWSISPPDPAGGSATAAPKPPSKRGAGKPASKRAGKWPRKQDNKENGIS
ncbi:hypothetical protein EWM64_g4442 [Hericium alpestre]|uniref:Uncharacterized protein n=1 Tax=Hericium alpestre TaxID=135208 RepID=A0A4Z0A185_9AGAM|nr:hypothetical protein EWM64_g4442 [Hericium alpestre]